MAILILLIIGIYIKLIKLLKARFFNIKYNIKEKFYEQYIGIDYINKNKIIEAIAINNNDIMIKKIFKKNKQLKKKKQCPK